MHRIRTTPTPKVNSPLLRANHQHTYIASNSEANGSTYAGLGQASARQGSFTALLNNAHGRSSYGNQPSFIQGKPQTQGSPAVAHNNPSTDDEGGPAITHEKTTTPGGDSYNDNNNKRDSISQGRPHPDLTPGQGGPSSGSGSGPSAGGGSTTPGPSQFDNGRQGFTLQ